MMWISFIGIMLVVFVLIVILVVRSGFCMEFVDMILGVNVYVIVYNSVIVIECG